MFHLSCYIYSFIRCCHCRAVENHIFWTQMLGVLCGPYINQENTCFKFGHFSPHVDLNQCTQCISSIYAFVVYNLQLKEVWIKRIKFWKQGRTGQDTLIHSLDLFIWSEWNLACDDNCYFLFFVEVLIEGSILAWHNYLQISQHPSLSGDPSFWLMLPWFSAVISVTGENLPDHCHPAPAVDNFSPGSWWFWFFFFCREFANNRTETCKPLEAEWIGSPGVAWCD